MKHRLQKWGNSLAIRVPKPFAEELGWSDKTPVAISLESDSLVIRTDRERAWDLKALLDGVTGENIHAAWEADSWVGEAAGSANDADDRGTD
jgi:antitoxin MazE